MKGSLNKDVLIKKELLIILENCSRPMNVSEIVSLFGKQFPNIIDADIKRGLLNLKLDYKILMNEKFQFYS